MEGKYTGTQRLLCLLVSFILISIGMYRDEFRVDSSFVYSDFETVSLQKADGNLAIVLFRDNRAVSQPESFNTFRSTCRSLAGMRPGHWATLFLIPLLLFLKFLIRERLLLFSEACENQYGRRTLNYIHQKDGKKA